MCVNHKLNKAGYFELLVRNYIYKNQFYIA
jgi:hypothetical protein